MLRSAASGMKREAFVERMTHRMTRLERLRTQGQWSTGTVPRPPADVDLGVMPLTRLALYVLSLPFGARVERRDELTGALRAAARRAAGPYEGSWGRVTAVLDDSFSSSGSAVKRRRPLAVALGCHYLLEALAAPGAAQDAGEIIGRAARPSSRATAGPRAATTRCSSGRTGRPRWACGSWTVWRPARTGS